MEQRQPWGARRYVTLLAVLAAHAVLFTTLNLITRSVRRGAVMPVAVDLVVLPPLPMPPLPALPVPARDARINTLVRTGAIDIDAFAPRLALPAPSAVEGSGSGVDWASEARRALQAYEIRKRQPLPYDVVASEPAEDGWWPRAQHRAGEQFKTAAGDWIVWINDDCYQIATPALVVAAPGATRPQTVCRAPAATRGP